MSTESADFGETGEDSQGQAVLNRYRDALVAGGGVGAKFRDAEKKALAKTKPATGVPASSPIGEFQAAIDALGRPQVAAEIESAMRSVYTWMYDKKMGPALEHALVEQEMPYFNELAEAFKSPDRINPGDFAPILTEVKKNNVEIMKEAGFAT